MYVRSLPVYKTAEMHVLIVDIELNYRFIELIDFNYIINVISLSGKLKDSKAVGLILQALIVLYTYKFIFILSNF